MLNQINNTFGDKSYYFWISFALLYTNQRAVNKCTNYIFIQYLEPQQALIKFKSFS